MQVHDQLARDTANPVDLQFCSQKYSKIAGAISRGHRESLLEKTLSEIA